MNGLRMCGRGYVSPWPVIVHIIQLQRFGYSYEQIGRAAGVSDRTVYACVNGRTARLQAPVAHAILAVTPSLDHLDPGTLISARGTRRRLQALACNGWSLAHLARELDAPQATIKAAAHSEQVTVRTHTAIATLFDRLWDRTPPASSTWDARTVRMTIARAHREGWVPALAWDDIDTDEDVPTPVFDGAVDMVAVQLVLEGTRLHLTREERLIALTELHAEGHLDPELADRLSVSKKTITRDRKTLGLPANFFEGEDAA